MKKILFSTCLVLALFSVGCRKAHYVAVGSDGFTCRSMDGIAWKQKNFRHFDFTGLAYGSGMYMAVSGLGSQGQVYSTDDGIQWGMQVTDNEHAFIDIASGGGMFVVLSSNGPIWSYDDATYWHPISAAMESPLKITYAAGHFMVSTATGIYYTTTPGSVESWQFVRVIPDSKTQGNLSGIACSNTTLIAADADGSAYYAAADTFTSPSNWTQVATGLPASYTAAVTYGSYEGTDTFILSSRGVVKKSIDQGRSWQDVTPGDFGNGWLTSGLFQEGQFLLCGPESGMYRSADGGETWEGVMIPAPPHTMPTAIAGSPED